MVVALKDKLGVQVNVPDGPEYTTALGAALLGLQRHRKMATTSAQAA
jgi:activator of 2-hydroxyglutaryl-CoA dehydratase